MKRISAIIPAIPLLLAASTISASQYVFPAKGQSPEQQKKDEYECHQWAVGPTGYDPVKAASQTQTVTKTVDAGPEQGSGARGALRGAAGGAIIANVAGGSGSKGAATGAVIGTSGHGDGTVFDGDIDFRAMGKRQFSLLSLNGDFTVIHRDGHAAGDGDGFFSDTAHLRSLAENVVALGCVRRLRKESRRRLFHGELRGH